MFIYYLKLDLKKYLLSLLFNNFVTQILFKKNNNVVVFGH